MNRLPEQIINEFISKEKAIIAIDQRIFRDTLIHKNMTFYACYQGTIEHVNSISARQLKPIVELPSVQTVIVKNTYRQQPTLQQTSPIFEFYHSILGRDKQLVLGLAHDESMPQEVKTQILLA